MLVALLVCLIPTTIGALLSAIGIAGMDRLVQHNVLAMSGRAVEAAGDVTTLLLDKTGTITLRQPAGQPSSCPCDGVERADLLRRRLPLRRWPTRPPRGARSSSSPWRGGRRGDRLVRRAAPGRCRLRAVLRPDPDVRRRPARRHVGRKGAGSAVAVWVESRGGQVPGDLHYAVDGISATGGTPLVVAVAERGGARARSAWSTSRTSSSRA